MWRFVVDEDMPRSTAPALRGAGWVAEDVRDVGRAGRGNREVLAYAQAQGAILVTEDKGFACQYAAVPARQPRGNCGDALTGALSTRRVNTELLRALDDLAGEDLAGTLIVVELGRKRLRRPPRP